MKQWRYEPGTKTIRSVPENYWICTFDSWEGAVNHEKNAYLAATAPQMLNDLKRIRLAHWQNRRNFTERDHKIMNMLSEAIKKAKG